MREIKFRAWDGTRMYVPDFLDDGGHPMTAVRHRDCLLDVETWDAHVVMQFTGLKDKNRKEIYEGDIVREDYKRNDGTDIGHNWIIQFGEYDDSDLEWGSPGLGFYAETSEDPERGIQSILYLHNPGVIGNIYENPELLKEKL